MQLILVAIVIFFPQTVTAFLDKEIKYDLDKVKIDAPEQEKNPDKERSMEDLFKQGTPVPGSDKVRFMRSV